MKQTRANQNTVVISGTVQSWPKERNDQNRKGKMSSQVPSPIETYLHKKSIICAAPTAMNVNPKKTCTHTHDSHDTPAACNIGEFFDAGIKSNPIVATATWPATRPRKLNVD